MRFPLHHIKHPQKLFDHFHQNVHHAFVIFVLAMVGMLWGASNILTPISASYVVGGFLTTDFWTQSPSNENITYALFGNGTAGATPYTRLWDTSCIPSSVSTLSTGYAGGTLSPNTIYILNSGNYTLTSPITMSGCSALVGNGDVVIKSSSNGILNIGNIENVIIDAIKFDGNTMLTGIISLGNNITFNTIDLYNNDEYGILGPSFYINNSHFYNNNISIMITEYCSINNSLFYNNTGGITSLFGDININNSQFTNHSNFGISTALGQNLLANNLSIYNNANGIILEGSKLQANNLSIYNNGTGILAKTGMFFGGTQGSYFTGYGTLQFFENTVDTVIGSGSFFVLGTSSSLGRENGQLDTGSETMDYNRVTNPQNGDGEYLLDGTNRTGLRGTQSFDSDVKPIRYIFGGNILKQTTPIQYDGSNIEEYGTEGIDYTETKYIAEPESSLASEQQDIVDQYFGADSFYTENRETNGCSLSAFEIVELDPGTFSSSNNTFADHTIYLLTGGEYRSTSSSLDGAFVFEGNCIALIGTPTTRFTKGGTNIKYLFYANNKRNIIIDTVSLDSKYYNYPSGTLGLRSTPSSGPATIGINLGGASNNNTINNTQVYNNKYHGISLGQSSHHNTINNSQIFNNLTGGIYLSYSSNYNIINNTQLYNNGLYGIWLANGSNKNTINNSLIYNNAVGIFGDRTTQNNVINKTALYNNSTAGISFKNSSNNILNDVRIHNNEKGIQTRYNSINNIFYGDLYLFDNSNNFDGTTANDEYLTIGNASDFAYVGVLSTGDNIMSCTYVSNPSFSGLSTILLNDNCNNTGQNTGFIITNNTLSYMYGLDMYKQSIPVKYESGNDELVELSANYYDTTKYIAEVGAVRDAEPENISFGDTSAVELNTRYTTNVYTAGIINTTVSVNLSFTPSTTSGNLIINGIAAGTSGTVSNGDTLQLYLLTPSEYDETVTATLTLGSVTTGVAITTRQRSQTPSTGSLTFASLTSLPVDTFTGSTVTISEIETGVLASISFVPSTTSGRLEIYSGGILISSGTTGLLVYNENQVKTRTQSSSGYGNTVTGNITIGLGTGTFTLTTKGGDIINPTPPEITYPLSGEYMFFVNFDWIASVDTGSGIEGYMYEIASDSSFMDITHTGFITTQTGTTGSPDTTFTTESGRRYFRIKAQDRDGNHSSRSNTGSFRILSVTDRTLSEITGANLISYYTSDIVEIKGMSTGVSLRASVSSNALLYKNGEERGTGAYVQNNDLLYIKIRSSNNYNIIKTGSMTIANRIVNFSVKTKTSSIYGCTLTDDDRDNIEAIFDSMVNNYRDTPEQYEEFLYTMQSMLEDEINFNNDCNLLYLQDLVKQALGLTQFIVSTGTHIAPNCKEYLVSYDLDTYTYTSPTLVYPIYFANRDTLTKYIDSKNAGDCHINTYGASSRYFTNNDPNKHIAPNGKIYIITMESGKYTSNNFMIKKTFSSLSELRNYIDKNNMPSSVWNHQVDTTFTPQIYTAPNAKEYKIYKTNRGYMSYKLLKVQYFSSLTEIQSYISRNNPN